MPGVVSVGCRIANAGNIFDANIIVGYNKIFDILDAIQIAYRPNHIPKA